jgi:hypothetical protein
MSQSLVIKLKALQQNLENILKGTTPKDQMMPPKYYDPRYTEDLFSRFYNIRDELIETYHNEFSDFPIRHETSSGTTDFENRGYYTRNQLVQLLNDIIYSLNLLEGLSSIEIPSMKVTKEGVFFAGQYYDAIVYFREIINQSHSEIIIIDGYISDKILDMLTSKRENVVVKILTKQVSPSLQVYAERFKQQYSGLGIKTSSKFHDRFVIIDDADFYHFGHSIKDLGNRGFMFSKIEEPFVIDKIREKFRETWSSSTSVI